MNNISENSKRSKTLHRLKQLQQRCYELEGLQIDMRRIARHESSRDLILMLALVGSYVVGTHFSLGGWGFGLVVLVTLALFYWDRKMEDNLPGLKLEGVPNMASDYALLQALKMHQDAGQVSWRVTDVNPPGGEQVVVLNGFDPLAIEVLIAEGDSLQTLMSLSPAKRKRKYAAAKKEIMPLILAGQAYAKEKGIELVYWLDSLASRPAN